MPPSSVAISIFKPQKTPTSKKQFEMRTKDATSSVLQPPKPTSSKPQNSSTPKRSTEKILDICRGFSRSYSISITAIYASPTATAVTTEHGKLRSATTANAV